MRSFILVILFVYTSCLSAQSFEKLFSYSSSANANEYAYAGIESSNGNYLIGIDNRILCLAPNGDSLWTKTYTGYGDIRKLFRDNSNQLLAATTKGKMVFLKINETNGDTISSIKVPVQSSNSGYTIYDALVLPDGDIVYSYNNGGSYGGTLRRFTPGSTTNKWSNDYAGQNWGPKAICLDDTTLIVCGYKGNTLVDLYVRKLSINNNIIWSKQLARNTYYADRLLGIQKNTSGNYLIATSFAINNALLPCVAVIGNNGDSLSVNSISGYNNKPINHGYLTSLLPSANGFYAAGYLNINESDPGNNSTGVGYMSVFSIADNGTFVGAKAYNNAGFYEIYPSGPYSGTEGWGNGCFLTSDGNYLLYGIGSKIIYSTTGGNNTHKWRGYVAKSNQLNVSVDPISKKVDQELLVYPNPSNGTFTIKKPGQKIGALIIQNSIGEIVLSRNFDEESAFLDLKNLPSGLYFAINTNKEEQIRYKIMITN